MLPKVIVGLVILFLAIFILRPFDPTGPLGKLSEKSSNQIRQNQSSQSNNHSNSSPVNFTHPIFNPDEIDFVSPLGQSNGGFIEVQPLGGMTVNIKKDIAQKGPIEVYAPTDLELTAYSYTLMEPEPTPDWTLHFKVNDNIELVLHHIKTPAQKLLMLQGLLLKRMIPEQKMSDGLIKLSLRQEKLLVLPPALPLLIIGIFICTTNLLKTNLLTKKGMKVTRQGKD